MRFLINLFCLFFWILFSRGFLEVIFNYRIPKVVIFIWVFFVILLVFLWIGWIISDTYEREFRGVDYRIDWRDNYED